MKKKPKGCNTYTLDKEWSKRVKELAGNKCELCSSTEKLEAHHINPRGLYNTRWYIPNGCCVCSKCHRNVIHRNPIKFYDVITQIRGLVWLRLLIEEADSIIPWYEKLEQIKEKLK